MSDAATLTERADLDALARGLASLRPELAQALDQSEAATASLLDAARTALEREMALEARGRAIRAIWLRGVAAEASTVLRSPTDREADQLAQRRDESFGYERDYRPEEIERRLTSNAALDGRRPEVVLFSSAQAAMTSALLALQAKKPLNVALLGSYFETRALLDAHASLRRALVERPEDAEIVIVEPLACDGEFTEEDMDALAARLAKRRHPTIVIADTTLSGAAAPLAPLINRLPHATLLQLASGLKLMQAGLELANVGVVTMLAGDAGFAEKLRETRTLIGSGLRSADALALEAPWFSDLCYFKTYSAHVFENNARLTQEVAQRNRRFRPIERAGGATIRAPYCVFVPRDEDPAALDALGQRIEDEAKARGLKFDRGGSFGFRGHRFDIIKPQNGDPPFLRVAMGRREGLTSVGIRALLVELAQEDA